MDASVRVPTIARRGAIVAVVATLLIAVLGAADPSGAGAASTRDCSGIDPAAGARMQRCDLAGAVLIGLDLHGIRLDAADLTDVIAGCDPDAPRTNLDGASLRRATAHGARLCDAILDDADLTGADLTGAALEDATLPRANLRGATLDGADATFSGFVDATLAGASWRDGAAIGARFDGADLSRIDLRGSNLRAADLITADLSGARLDGVDFTAADLTGADLGRASGLDTVIWSGTTCPDGSDSDANGGTCVGH